MVDNKDNTSLPPSEKEELGKLTRRDFIAGTTIALTGLATTGAALSPLLDAQETPSVDEIVQKHYRKLTFEDKKEIFARIPSYLGCDCFKRLSDFESLGLFLCPVQTV